MKILVIGGTAFIGPPVVRRLAESGHEIVLFNRGKRETDFPANVRLITGNRRTLKDSSDVLADVKPDVVLDMIPVVEKDALDLVDLFDGVASRIVGVSSQDVYRAYGRLIGTEPGENDPMPLYETSPLREKRYPYRGMVEDEANLLYHYDKIPIEQIYMTAERAKGTILRLPMVYGEGDYQHRLFNYLKRMDDGRKKIFLSASEADWQWSKGYVEDIAAAIALAVEDESATGEIYNVCDARPLTEADWVKAIGEAADWSGEVVVVPDDQMPGADNASPAERQDLVTDSSKMRQQLGFKESFDLPTALRRTVEWERANPPAQFNPADFDYEKEDRDFAVFL